MNDFISIDAISKADLEQLLRDALELQRNEYPKNVLNGSVIGSLFFEESTRTRISFETAAHRLGASVVGFSGTSSTSMHKKGESFADTIRMIDGYVDCIVMRHPTIGSAAEAAEIADVPVINAGDGANEHPTQTLLDLLTILQTQNTLENLTIGLVGDLKYGRVPHSLAKALSHWNSTQQIWIAPEELKMPEDIKQHVTSAGVSVTETANLTEALPQVDILMMTRVQEERFDDTSSYERVKDVYVLNTELLEGAKSNMKIMHPLPRRFEIPQEIDTSPHAYYFQQAANGVATRAALLAAILK